MDTSNRNLIDSLPEELFNPTYNNEACDKTDTEESSHGSEVLYDEDITAAMAQSLVPKESFDPNANYRLSFLRDTTMVAKITYRNDESHSVDRIEEFELKSEEEVQSLYDMLHSMGGSYDAILNDHKHLFENVKAIRSNTQILVAVLLVLLSIGVGFVYWCFRLKGVV